MIDAVRGTLVEVDGSRVVLRLFGGSSEDAGLDICVLCPAYLALRLSQRTGERVVLRTFVYFEGQGQGTHLEPRILGFETTRERAFFEVLTSVSGIGNRKALRALVHEPGVVARAIIERDAKFLATLPEIGKRMAERLITELDGKVGEFAVPVEHGTAQASGRIEPKPASVSRLGPAGEDAVAALITLGQQRSEAEERVQKALRARPDASNADEILGVVFGG